MCDRSTDMPQVSPTERVRVTLYTLIAMAKRLFVTLAMVFLLAACGGSNDSVATGTGGDETEAGNEAAAASEAESTSEPEDVEEEECDPDWDYCPNEADLLLEELGDVGLAAIRNGPYTVNRDPLSDVSVSVPCGESIETEVFRAQSVQGEGISLFSRGLIIWESADDLAGHIANVLATESGCVRVLNPVLEPNPDILLEPVEAFDVGDWSGVSFGYVDVGSGERAGAHVQLANGDQMAFAIADTPGLAKELARSVITFLEGGEPAESSSGDADNAGSVDDEANARFCSFFNQIDQSTGVPAGDELARYTEIADGLISNFPEEIQDDAISYIERYRAAGWYAQRLVEGGDEAQLRAEYDTTLEGRPLDVENFSAWIDGNC